jgi:hypothetical protein
LSCGQTTNVNGSDVTGAQLPAWSTIP